MRMLSVVGDVVLERDESLAREEPLQLRAAGPGQDPVDIAVTMRTPGHEEELAAGFLVTEGLIGANGLRGVAFDFADVVATSQPENEITVRLAEAFDASKVASRAFVATASCGICGKASIEDIERRCEPLGTGPIVARSAIVALPAEMRGAQAVFSSTGGIHAAALFTDRGQLIALREDFAGSCHSAASCYWSVAGRASRSCRRRPWPASPSCAPCLRHRTLRSPRQSAWA